MEDEIKGWEIQEYSPSGGDGKVMSRIIRRGLRIGKTIIITGVVISSAPFVLPPLMVASAVGLACSVPFGFFVASYACAEKLMSKLLPMPKPPPSLPLMLEYKGFSQTDEVCSIDWGSEGDMYEEEVDEEEDRLVVETEADLDSRIPLQMSEDVKIEGGVDKEDEERFLEDTKATVEMRIALPVGEERGTVPVDEFHIGKTQMQEQNVEDGYQEDDENLAQEEAQSTTISNNEIPGSKTHPMVEILRLERPVDNVSVDIACNIVEVEGPYGLTIGAVEQTSGGGKAGDANQGEQSMTIELEDNFVEKRPAYDKNTDDETQFTTKHRTVKIDDVCSTGVEDRTKMSGVLETAVYAPAEQATESPEYELVAAKDNKAQQNINITPIDWPLIGETQSMQQKNVNDQQLATDSISTTKRKKKTKKKNPKSGDTTEVASVEIHPKDREVAPSSTAVARGNASGSRLNMGGGSNKAGGETHSNMKAASVALPEESGTTSRTHSGRNLRVSPKQALFSEDKIWENIEALRTIVGYRAARHQTCNEELNALYVFTGVEPPISLKSSPDVRESSDLLEVNDKLRFLMAIVGVK